MYKNLISAVLLTVATVVSTEAMNSQQQTKKPKVVLVELINSYPQDQDAQGAAKNLAALRAATAEARQDLKGVLHFALQRGIDDIEVYKTLLSAGANPAETQHGETLHSFLQRKIKDFGVDAAKRIDQLEKEREALVQKYGRNNTFNARLGVYNSFRESDYPDIEEIKNKIKSVREKLQKKLKNLETIDALLQEKIHDSRYDVMRGGTQLAGGELAVAPAGSFVLTEEVLVKPGQPGSTAA